jgi:threonine dehydrogenase-like Zn-dependent dehydrogenase
VTPGSRERETVKALTWQGKRSVSVAEVPDPVIQEPTDAIVRITSTAICGSDLHLYEVLGPYMHKDDVLGTNPWASWRRWAAASPTCARATAWWSPSTFPAATATSVLQGLQSQCETTQVKDKGSGAALFGYSELYGSVPGGQAEYLRVPHADYGPVKVGKSCRTSGTCSSPTFFPPPGRPWSTRTLRPGGTLAVFGLGPVGQFSGRIGVHRGLRVVGIDPVPERREMAARHGVETSTMPRMWRTNCGR